MSKPPQPPVILNEVRRSTCEHEVFLAFVNDRDAEMFAEWWQDEGFGLYVAWCEENTEEFD